MTGEMKDALEAARRIERERYIGSQFVADARKVAKALLSTDKAEWNYDIGAIPRDGSHFVVLCTRMDEPPIAWRPYAVPSDLASSPPTDKAVGELREALEAARRAIGDHNAPHDCYATGPLTGDAYRDLVQCPACSFINMYAALTASRASKSQGGK